MTLENQQLHLRIAELEARLAEAKARAERVEGELAKARAEVDRLVDGCVTAEWRNSNYHIEDGHGFCWRFGNTSGFVYLRADAIAAVRKAAGLVPVDVPAAVSLAVIDEEVS